MAFSMEPITRKVRIGVDGESSIHVETWPMEEGWHRDTDPALSSGDPTRIILDVETLGAVRKFLNRNDAEFQKMLSAISDIIDLWMDYGASEDEYSDGYLDALTEVGQIAQSATLSISSSKQ